MFAFFSWWYGAGWLGVSKSFSPRLRTTAEIFSVNQLIRTLFAPWRRIISYPGASLQAKFQAWADNLFSRTIGFVVRIIFLCAAAISIAGIAVLTALELAVWPLLPAAVPGLIIIGLVI